MTNDGILNLVRNFISRCGFVIPVELMPDDKGTANYDPEHNVIQVDPNKIINEAKAEKLTIKDYIEIVISHELGHSLDEKLNERAQLRSDTYLKIQYQGYSDELADIIINSTYEAEATAYEKGKKFVPLRLMKHYNQMKKRHLSIIKDRTKKQVLLFKEKCDRLKELDNN